MSAIEWTAAGLVLTAFSLACFFLGSILKQHGHGIAGLNSAVITISTRLTTVETSQAICKKSVEDRLARGEQTFDRLDTQIESLRSMADEMKAISKQFEKMLSTIDERMWNQNTQNHKAGN